MELKPPYLLFLGDAADQLEAKTAFGLHDWRPEWCIGQMRLPGCKADLRLPDLDPATAAAKGVRSLAIGLATRGGVLPRHWVPALLEAVAAGLDIVSGLHDRLAAIPELVEAAHRRGTRLLDIRHPPAGLKIANGLPRTGRRLLTVGTDGYVGKKYTALAMERELRSRGVEAAFRATGQTGIMIAGGGIAVDAVPGDFITGAMEWLTPNVPDHHWHIVEGQGCLLSPITSTSFGLVNGAAAHALILCHDPARPHMRGLPHVPVPPIGEVMETVMFFARRRNPEARFIGLSINTKTFDEREALALVDTAAAEFNLPATDPVRFGVANLADRLLTEFPTRLAADQLVG